MKKNTLRATIKRLLSIARVILPLLLLAILSSSCKDDRSEISSGPFDNEGNGRTKIVVISDLHLGADLAYAEINTNLKPLENFLEQVRRSSGVKELVIAGDLLDEWFVPANIDTYQGKNQLDFVQRIANANKGVIDALNHIIKEGWITVTYVPGNHDLTITPENVAAILPGIHQARDEQRLGLGTYSPEGLPQMAIEHGHRYNFFCAPDPYSNQDVAPGTILPPGYFFTRIGALHVVQKCTVPGDVIPPATPNTSGDESQALLFRYWKIWEWALKTLPINNKFNEKIIITNIDGFTGSYAVNDILPYQTTAGGTIDVNLYKGIQDRWADRQAYNHVAVDIPTAHAITYAADVNETDSQSEIQYFTNPNSNKRIVVFGHTHQARIKWSQNLKGEKTIYANSGTWIDHNPNGTTTNFIVISPQNSEANSLTFVRLYIYENGAITETAMESLRL
jgi:Predicted ICC-like phosphoesterases